MWRDLIIYTPMYATFFWAIVLLSTYRTNNRAKPFLGIFMFAAFLLYVSHAIFFNRYLLIYQFFAPVYVFASLSVYPLYYWYIKLLTVETKINLRNLKMLFPAFFLSIVIAVLYLIMLPTERLLFIERYLLHSETTDSESLVIVLQKWTYIISRLVFAFQVIYYLILGSKLVVRYNNRVANFYSNLDSRTIVWVNLLLVSFVVTSLMSMVFNIIGRAAFLNNTLLLLIPSGVFSILLFIIGLQGYMQNYSVEDLELDEQQNHSSGMKKYNNAVLKVSVLELFANEAIYKNHDLKITHISAQLQTNRTYISNLINTEFSCTFSEFVNRYRIEEAKKLLIEESSKMFTLDYVSEKSGFGSLSTFIRVFRDSEGITPGRFRDEQTLHKKN